MGIEDILMYDESLFQNINAFYCPFYNMEYLENWIKKMEKTVILL